VSRNYKNSTFKSFSRSPRTLSFVVRNRTSPPPTPYDVRPNPTTFFLISSQLSKRTSTGCRKSPPASLRHGLKRSPARPSPLSYVGFSKDEPFLRSLPILKGGFQPAVTSSSRLHPSRSLLQFSLFRRSPSCGRNGPPITIGAPASRVRVSPPFLFQIH